MTIQYPKLTLLALSTLASYVLFQTHVFQQIAVMLNSHGYVSIFLAGLLFSYGFTTPFAIGFFVSLADSVYVPAAALLAGVGAVTSDLLIFRFIRSSFKDELDKLKLTWLFQKIYDLFHRHFSARVKKYILFSLAGFLIASPLPDEFGVSLISGFTKINQRAFAAIAYGFNTLGIFVILSVV